MSRKNKAGILFRFVGAAAALAMCSGLVSVKAFADSYSDSGSSYIEDEVSIPENYRDDVLKSLGRTGGSITRANLEGLEKLEISIENNSDPLCFINNCTSMKEFYLANLSDNIDSLGQIGKLDCLEDFTFDCGADTVDLNIMNCRFLYNNRNIRNLKIYGNAMAEPELVNSMPNLEKVDIEIRETMPLDLKKIPSLKETHIYGDPYDISINLSSDDIYYLLNNGVEVYINTGSFEQMKKIDAKLNEIIRNLDINEYSTDQEKLDAVIVYALKHFTYDTAVDSMSVHDLKREDRIHAFYKDGYLYGALEKDTQLCGNYAAFVTAVSTRLGLECYMMMSDVHCWNLVKVDGYYYCADTTWMDCNSYYDGSKMVRAEVLFEKGNKERLRWYMDQPGSYTDYDHQAYNFPEYLEDELNAAIEKGVYKGNYVEAAVSAAPAAETYAPVEKSVPAPVVQNLTGEPDYPYLPQLSDEQYTFMVYGTLIAVPAGIAAIIIAAVCAAKAVKKKKQEKDAKRYYSDYKDS